MDTVETPISTLSNVQFVIMSSLVSGTPYGAEYIVESVGIGYTLLFSVLLIIFLAYPFILIASELACIIPTNHGIIAYVYRGFYCISPAVGDIVGFLNGLNIALLYCVGSAIQPLIFEQYLETLTGELSYGQSYAVMLGVIATGFLLGIANIHIIGNTVNFIIIACIIPIFIGMFISIPSMNFNDTLIGTCNDIQWAPFVASMGFYAVGYEVTGNIMGEVSFDIKQLPKLFGLSLFFSTIIYFLPLMTVSTFYPSCNEWYDGLFAIAYKNIWYPLYYGIIIGCLFCTWAFYVIGVVFTGRVFWAMAQQFILLNKTDGTMVIPSEYDIISNRLINDDDHISYYDHIDQDQINQNNQNQQQEEQQIDLDEYNQINIGILPDAFGKIWPKTGSPVLGICVQSIIAGLVCLIPDYYAWTEFLMFMYAFTFFAVVGCFLILKYKEPNLYRPYQVPFGKTGAWITSISCLGIIVIIDIILAVALWEMFLFTLGINGLFIVYYIIWRKCGLSKRIKFKFCKDKLDTNTHITNNNNNNNIDDNILSNQPDTYPLL